MEKKRAAIYIIGKNCLYSLDLRKIFHPASEWDQFNNQFLKKA